MSADDQMAGDILDANDKLGEGLVEIGMTLGLPRPRPGATWGVPEVLVLAGQLMEMLGKQRARADVHPYDPFTSLAAGWRAQADDLLQRADQQTDRAEALARVPQRDRRRLDPDPEQLLQSARANKTTAATFMTAARNLDESIDFARRHVLDPS